MSRDDPPRNAPPTPADPALIDRFLAGDREAREPLLRILYAELHSIAAAYMRRERSDHTLSPTALVHEAYLRLFHGRTLVWNDKAHFLANAAKSMRGILVDHARARLAKKRGGGAVRVTLHDNLEVEPVGDFDILSVHEALEKLAVLSERQARVLDLRYFGGLSIEETAHVLGVSTGTVKSEARVAKAWLKREMG